MRARRRIRKSEREKSRTGVAREYPRRGAERRRAVQRSHLKIAVDNFVVVEQSNSGAMHHRHVALAAEFQHFCPQVATQIIPPAVIVPSPTAPHTARLLIAARATVVVVVDAGCRRRRRR